MKCVKNMYTWLRNKGPNPRPNLSVVMAIPLFFIRLDLAIERHCELYV